jgi:hypothetical protein
MMFAGTPALIASSSGAGLRKPEPGLERRGVVARGLLPDAPLAERVLRVVVREGEQPRARPALRDHEVHLPPAVLAQPLRHALVRVGQGGQHDLARRGNSNRVRL